MRITPTTYSSGTVLSALITTVGSFSSCWIMGNLSVLSLVAGIAPMFGFLGTIVGMFQLFYTLAATGEFTIQSMANGIYTKMITSATGLIIGMLAYLGYSFLDTQINRTANRMEAASSEFIDILQEPSR